MSASSISLFLLKHRVFLLSLLICVLMVRLSLSILFVHLAYTECMAFGMRVGYMFSPSVCILLGLVPSSLSTSILRFFFVRFPHTKPTCLPVFASMAWATYHSSFFRFFPLRGLGLFRQAMKVASSSTWYTLPGSSQGSGTFAASRSLVFITVVCDMSIILAIPLVPLPSRCMRTRYASRSGFILLMRGISIKCLLQSLQWYCWRWLRFPFLAVFLPKHVMHLIGYEFFMSVCNKVATTRCENRTQRAFADTVQKTGLERCQRTVGKHFLSSLFIGIYVFWIWHITKLPPPDTCPWILFIFVPEVARCFS
jgi:hypothetical protein